MSSVAGTFDISQHPSIVEDVEDDELYLPCNFMHPVRYMRGKWIWSRRAKVAEQVELLELGKAGGVSHKRKRAEDAEDVTEQSLSNE